jgi:hypothetical protein
MDQQFEINCQSTYIYILSVIDCDTVHVDRKISDHDGTYVSVEYACICSVIKSIRYII